MIRITITTNELEAKGHSGYAAAGSDIVCAGVSALINAFIRSAHKDIGFSESDAYSRIMIHHSTPETKAKFDMLVAGLRDIEEEFPEYVAITDHAFMS